MGDNVIKLRKFNVYLLHNHKFLLTKLAYSLSIQLQHSLATANIHDTQICN